MSIRLLVFLILGCWSISNTPFGGIGQGLGGLLLSIFSQLKSPTLSSQADLKQFCKTVTASEVVPPPQPATPPHVTPTFDGDDLPVPDPPAPATPPQATHDPIVTEGKLKWPNKLPPFVPPSTSQEPTYDGKEYRFKSFVFRPAQYTFDAFLILLVLVYTYLTYLGKRSNTKKVEEYLNTISPKLKTEFSQVGIDSKTLFAQIGPSRFISFATGRQFCESLNLWFFLRPKQDLPMILYEFLRSSIDFNWTGNLDQIELVFKIPSNKLDKSFDSKDLFVWALVEKSVMDKFRRDRWDVRTFTEVKELSTLPSNMVIMSESGEVTEQILKIKELTELLNSKPQSFKWFDSLVISGTPHEEPTEKGLATLSTPKSRTITLRLRLPPPSQTSDHLDLYNLTFSLLNSLNVLNLSSISGSKFAKRRTEYSDLILSESKKEKEKEKEEERRKRLKEIQDEKVKNMSASEQKKFDEKERKRRVMKMSKSAMKRK